MSDKHLMKSQESYPHLWNISYVCDCMYGYCMYANVCMYSMNVCPMYEIVMYP